MPHKRCVTLANHHTSLGLSVRIHKMTGFSQCVLIALVALEIPPPPPRNQLRRGRISWTMEKLGGQSGHLHFNQGAQLVSILSTDALDKSDRMLPLLKH